MEKTASQWGMRGVKRLFAVKIKERYNKQNINA